METKPTLRPLPRFVGITGFTKLDQVHEMNDIVIRKTREMKNPPVLMVGIMMSFKTLWNIPSNWDSVFPPKSDIENIFPSLNTGTLNTIHYVDFDPDAPVRIGEQDLAKSLLHIMDFAGPSLRAIQLDMTWPNPNDVKEAVDEIARQKYPVQVILQIGPRAFQAVNYDPKQLARRLSHYESIGGILLDESLGEGKILDPGRFAPYIERIAKDLPALHIAVAGGLSASTVSILRPLLEKHPSLSIDACSRLCRDRDQRNPIIWEFARHYVEDSLNLMRCYGQKEE